MSGNGGLGVQIASNEKYELRVINEYTERLNGLGVRPPNYTPKMMMNATVERIMLNERNYSAETFDLASMVSELSNEHPIADLAKSKDEIQIVPYVITIVETTHKDKTYFDAETDAAILAVLKQRKDLERLAKLSHLGNRLDPKNIKKAELDTLVAQIISTGLNYYDLNSRRTLMVPDRIALELMTSKNINQDRTLWDILWISLYNMGVFMERSPHRGNECMLFVESALMCFDGYAPYWVADHEDKLAHTRTREYTYSTDDFQINATPNALNHAFIVFDLTFSDGYVGVST